MNSIMLILFLKLLSFFLNHRQTDVASRLKNDDEAHKVNHLTVFNRFIVAWVYFLCILSLWNIGTLLVDGITKLIYGLGYGFSAGCLNYLTLMYKIVLPFKDLLIALSLAYLYYY